MKQHTLDVDLTCRRTRKRVFLAEMEQTVPWTALLALIAPHVRHVIAGYGPFCFGR